MYMTHTDTYSVNITVKYMWRKTRVKLQEWWYCTFIRVVYELQMNERCVYYFRSMKIVLATTGTCHYCYAHHKLYIITICTFKIRHFHVPTLYNTQHTHTLYGCASLRCIARECHTRCFRRVRENYAQRLWRVNPIPAANLWWWKLASFAEIRMTLI